MITGPQVYQLIRQVAAKVNPQRTRTGSGVNLTSLQIEALVAVNRLGNPTMRDLARGLMIVQPSATRIADDLVRKGLLRRISEKRDRRVTRLRVTLAGKELVERISIEGYRLLNMVLGKMKDNEQEDLVRGMEAFLNAIALTEQEVFDNCEQEECKDLIEESIMHSQKGGGNGD